MHRCNNCILSDTYPEIVFNEEQVYHLCESYNKPAVKGKEALYSALKIKKGVKYDCIVKLSGGLDSQCDLLCYKKAIGFNHDIDWLAI